MHAPLTDTLFNRSDLAASEGAAAWPETSSLAELSRILTLMYGPRAPTESTLKKWSAGGVFESCLVANAGVANPSPSPDMPEALGRKRAGRPGMLLLTKRALDQVHDKWPHLSGMSSTELLELAVARMSSRLEVLLGVNAETPGNLKAKTARDPIASDTAQPSATADLIGTLARIEEQVASLASEMAIVKRELAQFSSLRNNLITKLDDTVVRAQQTLRAAGGGGGADPLVEARRDRDMGVLKSMLSDVLARLEADR